MTKARDLASSGVTLSSTTTTADAALARAGGTMTGDLAMGTNLVDGVDVSARDAVLTSTTTIATAALPKTGGAMTGAITTNSTFDGVDIATRDAVLSSTTTTATNALNNANNALPKEGGAMTGPITTNSTFDGVDVGVRDSVLTSTTTTANAALPKAGGTMTGALTTTGLTVDGSANSSQAIFTGTSGRGLEISTFSVGAADEGVKLDATASGSTGQITLATNGTNRVLLDGNGDVLFGNGNGHSPKIQGTTNSGRTAGSPGYSFNDDLNTGMFQPLSAADTIAFSTAGTERLRIDNDGSLLLGQTAPSQDFGDGRVFISMKGTGSADYSGVQMANYGTTGNNQNLGILAFWDGTTSENARISAQRESATTDAGLLFYTRPTGGSLTERARIEHNGNLLVGKTASNSDANGVELLPNGQVYITANNTLPLYINRRGTSGDNELARFADDGSERGSISSSFANELKISASGSNSSGILFSSANQVRPMQNGNASSGSQDLGAGNGRWKDLYLSGGIEFGNASGNTRSITNNLLDDYEEGTWTPVLGGSTSTSGQSYAQQYGTYTKIGNTVHAHAYVALTSVGSVSGAYAYIMGLPFNVSNNSGAYPTLNVGFFANLSQNAGFLSGYANKGSAFSYVTFRQGDGVSIQYLSAAAIGNASIIFSIAYNTDQ